MRIFEQIGAYVRKHPEYAAKLYSNYSSFDDKSIARLLFQYDRISYYAAVEAMQAEGSER